jgi:hypothetical protein
VSPSGIAANLSAVGRFHGRLGPGQPDECASARNAKSLGPYYRRTHMWGTINPASRLARLAD